MEALRRHVGRDPIEGQEVKRLSEVSSAKVFLVRTFVPSVHVAIRLAELPAQLLTLASRA